MTSGPGFTAAGAWGTRRRMRYTALCGRWIQAPGERAMTTVLDDRVGQLAAAGRAQRLKAILRCPDCHGDLCWTATAVACPACGTAYPCGNERPEFAYPTADHTEDAAFQQERMHHRSLRGRMYDWGQRVITSEYAPHDHRAEFLAGLPAEAIAVEFGSGNRRLGESIINIDLFPFPNVDLTADIEHAPIADASVDYAILDSVIEHVQIPMRLLPKCGVS